MPWTTISGPPLAMAAASVRAAFTSRSGAFSAASAFSSGSLEVLDPWR